MISFQLTFNFKILIFLLFFLSNEICREQREREQREREQREKEQREKEQREREREREHREREKEERHFAQMYAVEMQRSLFLSGFHAASQRSSLGLGLGFPPGVPSLPPHMAGHPFSHMAAMAGIPSIGHSSAIPNSYNLSSHSSSTNAAAPNSLNLIQNRNHSASSPLGENALKSRSTVPSPAHSSSNIPSVSAALPKHYLPPHKYPDAKKHNASQQQPQSQQQQQLQQQQPKQQSQHQPASQSIATPTSAHDTYMSSDRHIISSSNRNSSNHNSNSSNSHFNAEQLKNVPKSTADQQSYAMHERDRTIRTTSVSSPYDATLTTADCKYSISLEKVKFNLVTNNDSRSEPMEQIVSSDPPPQAKFNAEHISPKKLFHLSSDNNKLKPMHFANDELNNGCQERSHDVKDLSGRFSTYNAINSQTAINTPMPPVSQTTSSTSSLTIQKLDDKPIDTVQMHANSADNQRSVGQSPDTIDLSKEPIVTNTNSTSLEHDSTISNNEQQQQQIANNKDINLSKMDTNDEERINAIAIAITNPNTIATKQMTEPETIDSNPDAAKSTASTKSSAIESPKQQSDELSDSRDKTANHSIAITKPSDTIEMNHDFDNAKKSPHTLDLDGDGTAVAVENAESAKPIKS